MAQVAKRCCGKAQGKNYHSLWELMFRVPSSTEWRAQRVKDGERSAEKSARLKGPAEATSEDMP